MACRKMLVTKQDVWNPRWRMLLRVEWRPHAWGTLAWAFWVVHSMLCKLTVFCVAPSSSSVYITSTIRLWGKILPSFNSWNGREWMWVVFNRVQMRRKKGEVPHFTLHEGYGWDIKSLTPWLYYFPSHGLQSTSCTADDSSQRIINITKLWQEASMCSTRIVSIPHKQQATQTKLCCGHYLDAVIPPNKLLEPIFCVVRENGSFSENCWKSVVRV